jgi:hypothetical protein
MTENRINLALARKVFANARRDGDTHVGDTGMALIAVYTRLARAAGEITDETPEQYR